MAEEHPNVALLKRFDLRDPASWGEVMAEDMVWHYANPNLPNLNGDHVGLGRVRSFFQTIGARFEGDSVAVDVVLVWRIIGGLIVEVWDIVSGEAEVSHDG